MLSDLLDDKLIDLAVKRKEQHYLMCHSFESHPGSIDLIDYQKEEQIKLTVVSGGRVDRL